MWAVCGLCSSVAVGVAPNASFTGSEVVVGSALDSPALASHSSPGRGGCEHFSSVVYSASIHISGAAAARYRQAHHE